MLTRSFCHLPTIGLKTEVRLWEAGLRDWSDFADRAGEALPAHRLPALQEAVAESERRLAENDVEFFARKLPASELWRLFPSCRDSVAYVDIETTGVGRGQDHITAIALYDGRTARTYVHGRNLADFARDILDYKLLVTFNGRCFDVPFIERELGVTLTQAHVDLRFLLKALGHRGGLKKVEKEFGLGRDDLDGVNGYFAVLLWKEFRSTGDERALETLLAYNVLDVLSLETLLVHAYNESLARTPFAGQGLEVPLPEAVPANPHAPCLEIVDRLRQRHRLF